MNHFLVGIDPAMSATGIVLLKVDLSRSKRFLGHTLNLAPEAVEIVYRRTIRTTKGSNLERLQAIRLRLREIFIEISRELVKGAAPPDDIKDERSIVIEDPTDYNAAAFGKQGRRGSGNSAALAGAAFGVLAIEASFEAAVLNRDLEIVPSQSWIPHVIGKPTRPLEHKAARELLRLRWPCLLHSTDHETFAGGVALYHLTGLRLNV